MKFVSNTSAYDTRALRKIAVLTWRALQEVHGRQTTAVRGSWAITVNVQEGRKHTSWRWARKQETHHGMVLILPKLHGREFVAQLRAQHGGTGTTEHHALLSETVAHAFQDAVLSSYGWVLPGKSANLNVAVRLAMKRRKVPTHVPLRIIKPKEDVPRDIIQERFQRVLELEQKWQRKLKLAQTKLKKIRQKKKHYTKKLASRQQED